MNNYKKILFFGLISLLFFVLESFSVEILLASAEDSFNGFNKDLKIGDNSEDIRFLQKFLNKNSSTEVSSFGAGSSDNETDFFGALTKKAVIKFQELYKTDILFPLGLKSGTGFVGQATRLKLNSLLETETAIFSKPVTANSGSLSKSSQSSFNSSKSASSVAKKAVVVKNSSSASLSLSENSNVVRAYSTSEYQVSPGKNLILEGEGFTSTSNTIHLGESNSIPNLVATEDGTKISFVVPKDLPFGEYSIWVTSANGTSKNEKIKIYIVVTDSPTERPVIEKVEPVEASIDSEIIVSGKGFTARGNNIYTMFGNVMNLNSSDSKTLKFKVSSMAQIAKMQLEKNAKNIPMEIWFYIVNDNGYNKEPASFVIKL